uniref:Trafficking protein particle complex subunit 13 n=2 Tax=Chrysotila carterae TaxID=13221 RepID=A0A7S4B2C3_CHRCT
MAAAPPRVADAAAENPVSLKVMRLCKPIFGFSLPVPFSSLQGDAPKEHNGSTDMLQQADDGDLSPDLEHIGCAITGALMLPQSFGDIFLGETFSCYVSLTNISSAELCQMGLKVEVQTQLQRETLSDSSLPENGSVARFAPQETLDRIIRYELKDLGIHILICSALYSDSLGERKYFRKFFKFQVQNPLSMKSKTHSLHAKNEILVETQLQNATQRPLFLESVAFLPTEHFEAEPLTDFDAAAVEPAPIGRGPDARARSVEAAAKAARCPPVGLPNFGHMAYLKPGDTQQHMYRLKGKQSPAQLRLVGALGRMEVVWKAQMGESGHLQSNTVQRKLPHTTARALEVSARGQLILVESRGW